MTSRIPADVAETECVVRIDHEPHKIPLVLLRVSLPPIRRLLLCDTLFLRAKPQIRDDNEYVTGSNLPRRKTSLPTEASTVSEQAAEELRRIRPGPIPMGSGR